MGRRRQIMKPARIGLLVALATLVLDQGSKLWLLYGMDLPLREPLVLAPFLELIVVWNRGISYGLFQQNSEFGRWLLLGLSVVATIGLSIWMVRARTTLLSLSLGMII